MIDYLISNKDFNYKVRELKRRKKRYVSEEKPQILFHPCGDTINELVLTNYWTAEMGKVFDAILTIIVKKSWTDDFGKMPKIKNKSNLYKFTEAYQNQLFDPRNPENFGKEKLRFPIDYNMLKNTHLFDKYSKITFTNIIKEIQKTKFQINNFIIRIKREVKDKKTGGIQVLPSIFNAQFLKPLSLIEDFKVDTLMYGISKSTVYDITFSMFGKCIIINSLLLSIDWIPAKIYNLSSHAQFLYKRYIVHRKQEKEFEIPYFELQSFLDITNELKKNSGYIMKALEELKEAEVISKYEEIGKRSINRFYKITRSKKDRF